MELRLAQRKQAKIKPAIQGTSGSGKTDSALPLAAFSVSKLCNTEIRLFNWAVSR